MIHKLKSLFEIEILNEKSVDELSKTIESEEYS